MKKLLLVTSMILSLASVSASAAYQQGNNGVKKIKPPAVKTNTNGLAKKAQNAKVAKQKADYKKMQLREAKKKKRRASGRR